MTMTIRCVALPSAMGMHRGTRNHLYVNCLNWYLPVYIWYRSSHNSILSYLVAGGEYDVDVDIRTVVFDLAMAGMGTVITV